MPNKPRLAMGFARRWNLFRAKRPNMLRGKD